MKSLFYISNPFPSTRTPECASISMAFMALFLLIAIMPTQSRAATVTIDQLGSLTPELTRPTGDISASFFADSEQTTIDVDNVLDTTADITIAWDMTFLTLDPNSTREFVFEVGNGASNGISAIYKDDENRIYVQAESGTSRLGGKSGGNTGPLFYQMTNADLSVSRSWVVSLDVDATAATLNLFVDGTLIGSVTGNGFSDWSDQIQAAYFEDGDNTGGNPLREGFDAAGLDATLTAGEATADSHLRFYENVFVTPVPEPEAFVLTLFGVAGLGLICWRRRSRCA